ncbi:MAG: FGGY-family carbohydrate kinase [Phycisphaeraceae bacterium]
MLAFDLGTTYFKAAVFGEKGALLALARRPTPIQPHTRFRQITPQAFEQCLVALATELAATDASLPTSIDAVCFATQTNSFLLLDEQDAPLTPIILWSDRRAAEDPQWLKDALPADDELRDRTGIPALGPAFMVAKLAWLRRHDPGLWPKVRHLRLIGDQLAWWLTGRHVTEGGAAGLSALLDIHTLKWRSGVLDQFGLPVEAMPLPMHAGQEIGPIRKAAAARLGLRSSCRVFMGCLDQYAGAIGAGNTQVGGVSETTGTVLATVTLADHFDAGLPAAVFQGPAWRRPLYWRMCFGNVSANLVEALRNTEHPTPDYDTLNCEAAAAPRDCGGLRLDSAASAVSGQPVFIGHRQGQTRGHQVRAVFQGVADALKEQVDTLVTGRRPAEVISVGGAAQSDLWLQIKADTLGMPVVAIDAKEPTCLGAAALALAGLTGQPLEQTVAQVVHCRGG